MYKRQGSKSITNRALLIAALASGRSVLKEMCIRDSYNGLLVLPEDAKAGDDVKPILGLDRKSVV